MKQILFAVGLLCATLPVNASAKEYGDFTPGQTFTLTVVDKSSKRYTFWDTDKVSVPGDVPNYAVGSKVKFTIGKRGQLTARDGLYLRYFYEDDGKNYYGSETAPDSNTGKVSKGANVPAKSISLRFVRVQPDWFGTKTTIVTYKLR